MVCTTLERILTWDDSLERILTWDDSTFVMVCTTTSCAWPSQKRDLTKTRIRRGRRTIRANEMHIVPRTAGYVLVHTITKSPQRGREG